MSKPDILMFMTDQHTPYYSDYYGHNVDTPFLDYIAENGTSFDEAYTVCPLCVPARCSFVTAKRPAETGCFGNSDPFSDLTPTFMNYLVAEGYETVLVGRMHFVGPQQKHGFTKRIFPDCTTISYVRDNKDKVRGVYESVYGGFKNTNLVGGGDSSSSYYDQQVVNKAIEYLSEPHDKPQFIVVSIYSPHHPYVGKKELYEKYHDKVVLPQTFERHYDYKQWEYMYRDSVSEQLGKDILAAYCAMVETVNNQAESVFKAFEEYCNKKNSEKLFVYFSDHGDHLGDRRGYGKTTYYEKSAKIPLLFYGDNIEKGHKVKTAASIMDIGPTILDFIGADPMIDVDGVSMAPALKGQEVEDHPVYAEEMYGFKEVTYGFMLKYRQYKYMIMMDEQKELLFDTVNDPDEINNLIEKEPEKAEMMRNLAKENMQEQKATAAYKESNWKRRLWAAYDKATGAPYNEENAFNGPVPEHYLEDPEIKSEFATNLDNPKFFKL